MSTMALRRTVSRILSRRNTLERKVDEVIVERMGEMFPQLLKEDTVDPARTAMMAAISNIGALAFGAYREPEEEGLLEQTENGTRIKHLQWDFIDDVMEGVLKITLKDAKNLRDADILWNGESDPYVVFSAGGSFVKSATINDNRNPVWNSTHYLYIRTRQLKPTTDNDLKINVYDCDAIEGAGALLNIFNKDDHLGSAMLSLDDLKKEGLQSFELKLEHRANSKKNPSTIRFCTEFISVETAIKEMNIDKDSNAWPKKLQPRALEWMDVSTMTDSGSMDVEKLVYFDAPSTGTQAWVHANVTTKVVVVAFRGTEMNRLKDIIADMNFIPTRLNDTKKQKNVFKYSPQYLDKRNRVHSGFKNAYDSIREYILRIVYDITGWEECWTVIVTGHSLGGALATLCAFELSNIELSHSQKSFRAPQIKISSKWRKQIDIKGPKICMMNFGAPRVGNETFVKNYNQTMIESFRVVNANDLIHFLPPMLYRHTNFEVLLRESGRVNIDGVGFQSGISREVRDLIDCGKINEKDILTRAFSHLSIHQHLGTHYLSLVQAAVQKFVERMGEVMQCTESSTASEELSIGG